MSKFINTVDVIGDAALTDSIIDRSITEYKDEYVTTIGSSAFAYCDALTIVDVPNVTRIESGAFRMCGSLEAVIIRSDSCYIHPGAFQFSSVLNGLDGYIYVPKATISQYMTPTLGEAQIDDQFRAIEDYPDICG